MGFKTSKARETSSVGLHTKGPWGIEETKTTLWVGRMREDGKCGEIVSSHEIEGLKKECESVHRANARLIATAPELLRALKDLVEAYRALGEQWAIERCEDGNFEARGEVLFPVDGCEEYAKSVIAKAQALETQHTNDDAPQNERNLRAYLPKL